MDSFPHILKWTMIDQNQYCKPRWTEGYLCYVIIYMIFQYRWDPVLIHRILIGFEVWKNYSILLFFLLKINFSEVIKNINTKAYQTNFPSGTYNPAGHFKPLT